MKRLNHELKTFVGSPFAEGEDAVLGIAAPGKVRVFRSARENAMGTNMNIVVTIFLGEDFAISRYQYGNRIR